ncbi:hypothetical protein F0562_021241 [Nyssa sinensis]|uniref:Uncharacterized protein n=1 Tax=Nyssa sinensis TaxID=561372 RepID=A0A5J5BKJ9_9ASTE|nr:hypothetical protein F0562_021241 [Nyssa sinensis]
MLQKDRLTSADTPPSSPADSSNETPSESNIPSGTGTKTVPPAVGASSNGINIKSPLHVVFLLFIRIMGIDCKRILSL